MRNPRRIGIENDRLGRKMDAEFVSRGIDQWSRGFDRTANRRGELDALPAELQFAARNSRDLQQVVDQPHEVGQLAFEHAARLLRHRRLALARFQQLDRVANGSQRVAEFVSQRRQKFVLPPVRVLERLLRAFFLRDIFGDSRQAEYAALRVLDGKCAVPGSISRNLAA